MPAQWPTFIKNVSEKMSSRSTKDADDFGTFMANEYFNAVKTAQTPFGNIHKSGKKDILEAGFKDAFNKLYESVSPELDDKEFDPNYSDMFEEMPVINANYNAMSEFEDWTIKNAGSITDFRFYEFFQRNKSGIFVNALDGIDTNTPNDTQPEITLIGTEGGAPYSFIYSINEIQQPEISSDDSGIVKLTVPVDVPGNFKYTLISVIGSDYQTSAKIINTSVEINVPADLSKTIEASNNSIYKIEDIKESDRVTEVAKRVYYQNDGSIRFKRWVSRLSMGYAGDFGKSVEKIVEGWINTNFVIKNPLNKKLFQEEHIDDKKNIPDWIVSRNLISKFTYIVGVDDVSKVAHIASNSILENARIKRKEDLYKSEKDAFRNLKKRWVNDVSNTAKTDDDLNVDGDPYDIMAKAIINYWKSTATSPFSVSPPVPPCNIPSPGKYIPISYGSEKQLSSDLRKAWNTGKLFKPKNTLNQATKAVAIAIAVSCARHLLGLKFVYNGKITAGPSTLPMIGFVPTSF